MENGKKKQWGVWIQFKYINYTYENVLKEPTILYH